MAARRSPRFIADQAADAAPEDGFVPAPSQRASESPDTDFEET